MGDLYRSRTKPRHRYPAIPREALRAEDVRQLTRVLEAVRERLEILIRERGRLEDSAATLQDLIDLNLVDDAAIKGLRDTGSLSLD